MTIELVSRIDLDQLYPPFMEKVLNLLAACQARGADYYALSGYRSFVEQAKLYAQGRTQPGNRVTNAAPGYSAHNFGLGLDVVRDSDRNKPKLQPGWNTKDYTIFQEELRRISGLKPGPSWDVGHVELDISQAGLNWGALRTPYLRAAKGQELKDVWALLDAYSWA